MQDTEESFGNIRPQCDMKDEILWVNSGTLEVDRSLRLFYDAVTIVNIDAARHLTLLAQALPQHSPVSPIPRTSQNMY